MRHRSILAMLLALSLVLAAPSGAFGTSASFDVERIAGWGLFDLLDQQGQDLGGRYLVYESRNVLIPDSKYKLYVYDRYTNETTALVSWVGEQTNADVWNGLVVYEYDSGTGKDVRIHDLRTGADAALASGAGDQMDPRIQDNVVVWHDGTDVAFRDLRTGTSGQVPAGVSSAGNVGTSRGYVYYQDDYATTNVYRYDHSRVETECISGSLTGIGNWAGDLAVHDDTVVWRGMRFVWPNPAIRAYDVRAGVETTLASNQYSRSQPDAFGNASAWVDAAGTGVENVKAKIEGWSWGSVYTTTTAMGDPAIYGNSVAFGTGSDVWLGEHPTTVIRVAGDDRYETAAATSARHFAKSRWVVLASGENWPDALSATGLAGALDCPLLLVRKDSIPDATYQEIVRLGATDFMLVGGAAAVSEDVFETFQLDFGEFSIQRVWGTNRYHTAARVAQWVYDITAMAPVNPTWFGEAIIVSGENYADALTAGPLSAARHLPILLTRQDSLPPETAAEIDIGSYRSAVIVGGEAAVSTGVKGQIDAIVTANPGGYVSTRLWGANRYATAAAVAEVTVGTRRLDLGLATGQGYADALGAGAALGSYGSPLLLTRKDSLPPATQGFLDLTRYEIGELQVFGGTAAVSEAVRNAADAHVYP